MDLIWHDYPREKPRFSGLPMFLESKDSPYYIIGSWNPEKKQFCMLYDTINPEGAQVKIEEEISRYAYIPLEKKKEKKDEE